MASVETIYRSFIQCINEERWQDLLHFASSPLSFNGQDVSLPEAFADIIKAGGRIQLDLDVITVDERTWRLGATVLAKLQPARGAANNTVEFMQQHLTWVKDGKITKVDDMVDYDDLGRQLSDPSYSPTPDLIGGYGGVTGKRLSTRELEETYRAYIGCINAQTMATDLPKFCHPQVIHNTKPLSLEEYRLLIQEAFTAIPDIVFGIDTVVADEGAQRIAVRLEFTGTPTGKFADAEPTGRSVRFYEYVTYYLRDGKIARVWSIVDWQSFRRQLSQE
ncbi:SnoaL-domain-containing protein [Xylariaceae sp. AK1471]|nr:SnoaL-domain-containing protein [Xylariaceae sp. AK1471]